MADRTVRLRRSWAQLVGPEATGANIVVALAAGAAGMIGAPVVARRRGAGPGGSAVVSVLAGDLVGGAYVNNTRACARWYQRPGQGTADHLMFAALHVHPAVLACLDRGVGRRARPGRWSLAHYGYLMAATLLIRRLPEHRRGLGVALTAGGLLLDAVLGPSRVAPWFAWTYYPKLLMGHAAASLWDDTDLHPSSDTPGTPPARVVREQERPVETGETVIDDDDVFFGLIDYGNR